MKQKICIKIVVAVLAFFLCPTLALYGQVATADSVAADSAWLAVDSSTPGCDVYLNGKLVGKTPLHFLAVDSGRYELLLSRNAQNNWMMTNWKRSVELTYGDSIQVFAQLERPYLIKSQPFGAEVYLDGRLRGTTPFILELSDTMTTQVTLVLEGYRPTNFICQPDGPQYLETVLEEDPVFASQKQQILQEATLHKARHGRRALIFTGLSLATGITAMALKNTADDAYNQYLQSGNPQEREAFFNRAEKYDRYTSVAMGAFQVNLVMSLYFFYKSQK